MGVIMCNFNDFLIPVNNLLIYLHDDDPVIFGLVVFLVLFGPNLLLAAIILNIRRDNNH